MFAAVTLIARSYVIAAANHGITAFHITTGGCGAFFLGNSLKLSVHLTQILPRLFHF